MAKQLFISPVVGDGSIDSPFRPSLVDTVTAVNAGRAGAPSTPLLAAITVWQPTDPSNGHPLRTWCLCIVAARDLRPFQAVTGVHPLPVFPLDGKVSAVQRSKLQSLITKLDDLGINTGDFLLNSDGSVKADGWREVIRGIGKAAGDTSFSEDAFDGVDIV